MATPLKSGSRALQFSEHSNLLTKRNLFIGSLIRANLGQFLVITTFFFFHLQIIAYHRVGIFFLLMLSFLMHLPPHTPFQHSSFL